MMFDTLGPWMGMIVYLKMKDGKYVRELKLDEAEGSPRRPPPPERIGQPSITLPEIDRIANARLNFVPGDPVDDSIACAVNGQNIFTLPAKLAHRRRRTRADRGAVVWQQDRM